MNRGKFRLLLAISVVCLCSSTFLHHYGKQENVEDFLKGMGYTVLVGTMVMMPKKPKLQ